MKTKLTALLLATTTVGLLAGGAMAQMPAQPLAAAKPMFDVAQLPATKGVVKYFTMTPRGDIDGFVMADGTQVHLPPHLSGQLVAAVKPGDAVTVRGLRAAAIPLVAAMAVTGDVNGQTVVDAGPPGGREGRHGGMMRHGGPGMHGGPAAGPASEVSGKVWVVLHGPRGEANGAMLEDGTVLRLPPPEVLRMAAQLAPGQAVVAQGRGIANSLGRVVEVRMIGASREQLVEVRGPRHGPGRMMGRMPGGPDAPAPARQ